MRAAPEFARRDGNRYQRAPRCPGASSGGQAARDHHEPLPAEMSRETLGRNHRTTIVSDGGATGAWGGLRSAAYGTTMVCTEEGALVPQALTAWTAIR